VRGKLYASRNVKNSALLMHRAVMNAKKGELVDHKDGNGLNNQKSNLRLCTNRQNLANSQKARGKSRFKGVYWNTARGKWQAQIGAGFRNGKLAVEYLGRFENEEEAARAYDRRAFELHGEFAVLNFP
jgi:hypothetical protein